MHHGGASGVELAAQVARASLDLKGVEVVVAPPFTALASIAHEVTEIAKQAGRAPIGVSAQNLYPEVKGAFTGEVSPTMLKEAGCSYVILGHSERRQYFHESDAFIAKKIEVAIANGLHPIACIGETLDERQAGRTLEIVLGQLRAILPALKTGNGAGVIAYEPVWAIGTGKTATPADAEEVHAAIRKEIVAFDAALAAKTRILYGGSMKPDNALELLKQPNIDGGLVGGAALDIKQFGVIIDAARQIASV
jgi:triosephosphate isomerase